MDLEKKQFLSVPFKMKQLNNEDPDVFVFEGYASTFGNIDRDGEIIAKGAFDKSLKEFTPKLYAQHNLKGIEGFPIGDFTTIKVDEIGLFVRAEMPRDDERVRGVIIPQIKKGNIDSMSIGFIGKESEFQGNNKVFTEVMLFEVSLVGIPANERAIITAKSFKETEIKSLKDIETFLKAGGMSQSDAKTLISNVKQFSNQCEVEERMEKQRDVVNHKLDQILKCHADRKMDKIINNLNK